MHRTWLALLVALVLTVAACGADEADETADEDAPDTEEAEDTEEADEADEAEEAEEAEPAEEATVMVASTELGDAVVDGEGMALYLFEPDEQGDSTCYDGCAQAWPPLIDEDPVAGDGVDQALLGTTERDDGSVQVTYDGWPLYHWASDNEPGDITGQGVQDVWWLVDPSGAPITDAEEAAEDDGYGY